MDVITRGPSAPYPDTLKPEARITQGSVAEADRIQPGHPLFGLVWINPERVSGAPCFYATRVPLKNLFDSLIAGESIEEFLDGFEGVTREQVLAILKLAGDRFLFELEAR